MTLARAARQKTESFSGRILADSAALYPGLGQKIEGAQRLIANWLQRCSRPVVSVSGGKDSVATLQLVRSVEPSVPALVSHPPYPLPDRRVYLDQLIAASGGPWHEISYHYDVGAVVRAPQSYPHGLKQRGLVAEMGRLQFDGLALGLRAAESDARAWNLRARGRLYRARGQWVCTPVATWTAEEVVGLVLGADVLPVNPVYTKLEYAGDLESLRDGSWICTPVNRPGPLAPVRRIEEHLAWIERHYPQVAEQARRFCSVFGRKDGPV